MAEPVAPLILIVEAEYPFIEGDETDNPPLLVLKGTHGALRKVTPDLKRADVCWNTAIAVRGDTQAVVINVTLDVPLTAIRLVRTTTGV